MRESLTAARSDSRSPARKHITEGDAPLTQAASHRLHLIVDRPGAASPAADLSTGTGVSDGVADVGRGQPPSPSTPRFARPDGERAELTPGIRSQHPIDAHVPAPPRVAGPRRGGDRDGDNQNGEQEDGSHRPIVAPPGTCGPAAYASPHEPAIATEGEADASSQRPCRLPKALAPAVNKHSRLLASVEAQHCQGGLWRTPRISRHWTSRSATPAPSPTTARRRYYL